MNAVLSEVLKLSGELVGQDKEEKDFGVTEFGEKLTNSNDMELLWVARNASGSAKNATSSIKNNSFNLLSVFDCSSIQLYNALEISWTK